MDAFECPIGLPYRLFLRRPVNGGDDLQQVHLASIRWVSIDIGQAAHCNSQQSDGCKRRQPGRDGFRAPDRLRVGMRPGVTVRKSGKRALMPTVRPASFYQEPPRGGETMLMGLVIGDDLEEA